MSGLSEKDLCEKIEEYLKAGASLVGLDKESIMRTGTSIIIIGPGIEIEWNEDKNKWDIIEITWQVHDDDKSAVVREQIDEYDREEIYILSKEVLLNVVASNIDDVFNEVE